MSKAGSRLARAALIRAADHARKQDPQLAKVYYTQMVERGAEHLKALCVVASRLAERAWTVMHRRMPYVICDTDGTPVTPYEAKTIIAEQWTVPADVRARRRSTKPTSPKAGKALNESSRDMSGQTREAPTNEATFPTNDRPTSPPTRSSNRHLDSRSPIGNQPAATAATAACGRRVASPGRCRRSTSVKPARASRSANASTGQR